MYQYFKNHPNPSQPHHPSYLQPNRKRSSAIFLNPNTFQQDSILIDAANLFKTSFFDLYETPRIQVKYFLLPNESTLSKLIFTIFQSGTLMAQYVYIPTTKIRL